MCLRVVVLALVIGPRYELVCAVQRAHIVVLEVGAHEISPCRVAEEVTD